MGTNPSDEFPLLFLYPFKIIRDVACNVPTTFYFPLLFLYPFKIISDVACNVTTTFYLHN